MRKRWLGLGLALLIGTSVAVSDIGVMQVSATKASGTEGSQSSNTGAANSTADNAKFTVDGNELVVTENLNPNKYPKDFTETKVECKGRQYKGLKFQKADIQMICLLNQKTGVAAYYIYQDSDQSVYPFIRIESGDDYIIAMPPFMMEETQVPSGYNQTELEFEKGKAQVYQAGDNTDSYLIYAMDSEGNKDWYEYNTQDKTYQIYETKEDGQGEAVDQSETQDQETVADAVAQAQAEYEKLEEKYTKEKSHYLIAIAVLIIMIAILVILLFNSRLSGRRRRDAEEEDYYDEEEDFYGDYDEDMEEVLSQETEAEETDSREEEESLEEEYEEKRRSRIPHFLRAKKREREVDDLLEEEFFEQDYEELQEEPEPPVKKAGKKSKTVMDEPSPKKKEEKYENDIEILDLNDL